MNCNEEVTSIDISQGQNGEDHARAASSGDESNLYAYIDRDQVHGLNLSDPEAARTPIKPWDQRNDTSTYAESGVDDQFIVTVPFICSVRLKSILLYAGHGDFAPRRVRMFANRPVGIDFEEVAASSASEIPALPTPTSSSSGARQAIEELSGLTTAPQARPPPSSVGNVGSGKPQADFALLEATNGVVEYPLPIARFQNTTSVSIVFSDSNAGELSRMYYVGFRGTALQLKQEPGEKLDIAAANAADAPVDRVRETYGAAQNTNVR